MNEFLYKQKREGGRPPVFSSPDELWQAAVDYFEWVDSNPLKEMQYKQSGGEPVPVYLDKLRPYTLEAFCIYNGIGTSTFHDYSTKDNYKEFSEVTRAIRSTIRNQKYEAAASGFLNPNIIAYDLGLNKEQKQELPPITVQIVNPHGDDNAN